MVTYAFSELLLGPIIQGSNHLNKNLLMTLSIMGTYKFLELLLQSKSKFVDEIN